MYLSREDATALATCPLPPVRRALGVSARPHDPVAIARQLARTQTTRDGWSREVHGVQMPSRASNNRRPAAPRDTRESLEGQAARRYAVNRASAKTRRSMAAGTAFADRSGLVHCSPRWMPAGTAVGAGNVICWLVRGLVRPHDQPSRVPDGDRFGRWLWRAGRRPVDGRRIGRPGATGSLSGVACPN